jgi:hypothetical protein
MDSFRRIALLLALGLPALGAVQAQSSSSNPAPADQAQAPAATQPAVSVQARIRARREQRRVAAIREAYSHLYEAYAGGGYLRFTPGSTLQRVNEYNWDLGVTRYYSERLGVTVDGRGTYGSPFIEPKTGNNNITKPAISQYAGMIGPNYRFYLQPKYSVSGRVLAGVVYGNFSGDTSNNQTLSTSLGLYPNTTTFAASASLMLDYNLTPSFAFRVAPEYVATGFGSTVQNNLGYTITAVYRFGKQ